MIPHADSTAIAVSPLRYEDSGRMLIAGLEERYGNDEGAAIAAQWRRFATYLGRVSGQVGRVAYGISSSADEGGKLRYLTGVQVSDFSSLPRNFGLLCMAAQRWAVFPHQDHISSIRTTRSAICTGWLCDSSHEVVDAPWLERYGESFDPRSGTGDVEIWVPVRAASGQLPQAAWSGLGIEQRLVSTRR